VTIDLAWTLPDQDGRRFVYVQFKDGVGHASPEASDSVILDRLGPIVTPVSPAPGATGVASLNTIIRADWRDDTSASATVVGVNSLTGRMLLRNDNLGLAPVDVTARSERTSTGITYKPPVLNPCTQYTVTVTVSDNLGNPSSETSWPFVTACT
jgi:hypothetical protein